MASELQYVFHSDDERWSISATKDKVKYFPGWLMLTGEGEIRTASGTVGVSARERGVLEIKGSGCPSGSRRLRLWSAADLGRVWLKEMQRRMGLPPQTAEELADRMCVSEPQVLNWDEEGQNLWLGIGFYAGEGCGGVGTILQVNKAECSARAHQPPELATYSISHVATIGEDLWLGTGQSWESGWFEGIGLVRYNTPSGNVERFSEESPLSRVYITAMALRGSTLWLATPGGFFALDVRTRVLRSWRLVPIFEISQPTPVSSRPKGEIRSWLGPGVYEVRWLGPSFAEVLTPDCTEGWAESAWVTDTRIRGSSNLTEIAGSEKWGNPSSLRVYSAPVNLATRPKPQGWFLRANVEPIGSPEGDWQRARVCAGWVEARPDDVKLSVEEVR